VSHVQNNLHYSGRESKRIFLIVVYREPVTGLRARSLVGVNIGRKQSKWRRRSSD